MTPGSIFIILSPHSRHRRHPLYLYDLFAMFAGYDRLKPVSACLMVKNEGGDIEHGKNTQGANGVMRRVRIYQDMANSLEEPDKFTICAVDSLAVGRSLENTMDENHIFIYTILELICNIVGCLFADKGMHSSTTSLLLNGRVT
jgi:hypothetical protein